MLTTFIAAIAFAAGLALPHGHAAPVLTSHGHVASFDGSGGGPPLPIGP